MKSLDGSMVTYDILHEDWFTRRIYDEPGITVRCLDSAGLLNWEFTIYEGSGSSLRLEIYNDAWVALADFGEFFEVLSGDLTAHRVPSPITSLHHVVTLLAFCGAKDTTVREQPKTDAEKQRKEARNQFRSTVKGFIDKDPAGAAIILNEVLHPKENT